MRYMFLIYRREAAMAGRPPKTWSGLRRRTGRSWMKPEAGDLRGRRPFAADHDGDDDPDAGGKPLILDGPFAETKEQLAGYYILDCKDLDEAIGWAGKIPSPCKGGGVRRDSPDRRPPAALAAGRYVVASLTLICQLSLRAHVSGWRSSR